MTRRATWFKLCSTKIRFFLTEIHQECLDIVSEDMNVEEEYEIGSSLTRGAEVKQLKTGVPEPLISVINLR